MHNDEFYELTQQQRGIWYTEKLYPETSIGVVAGTFRFKGNINYKTLEKAINIFVKTNDAMRTRITEHNGEAKQYFAEYEPFNVELLDFSDKETSTLYDWEKEQTMQPMELLETPLFKFTMIKISDTEGGYLIKTHHLISDAWSMTVIVNNVARIYFELIDNKYIEEQAPSYIEYIKNYEKYTKSDKFQKDHEYWINKYNVAPEVTALKPRTQKEQSVVSNRKTFVLPEKLCKKIYEYSKENNVSVFSMYMSAISMYIHRITGKENLNLGTIILNRANQKEKNTMGMFITTLPVVLNVTGNTNFNDLMLQ